MRSNQLATIVRKRGGIDADYQLVLDKATALGYTQPSAAQQSKQSSLVKNLKASGVWDLLDVFYCFANDGSNNFATINWKDPDSFQLTFSGTPTFTSNEGFKGTASAYIETNFVPSIDSVIATNSSASRLFYFNAIASGNAFGSLTAAHDRYIANNGAAWAINTTSGTAADAATNSATQTGLHVLSASGSGNRNYKNKGLDLDSTSTETGLAGAVSDFCLLRYLTVSAPSTMTMSFYGFGANVSSLFSSMSTHLDNYMNSL